MWWLLVLLIFFLVLTLFVLPVTLQVRFWHQERKNSFQLKVSIWPGLAYQFLLREKEKGVSDKSRVKMTQMKDKMRKWYLLYKTLRPFLFLTLSHLKLERVRWHTMIGLSDAAKTGMAVGWLWGVKGFILQVMYHFFKSCALPEVKIFPVFITSVFAVNFDCTFKTRVGYLLAAGVGASLALVFSAFRK